MAKHSLPTGSMFTWSPLKHLLHWDQQLSAQPSWVTCLVWVLWPRSGVQGQVLQAQLSWGDLAWWVRCRFQRGGVLVERYVKSCLLQPKGVFCEFQNTLNVPFLQSGSCKDREKQHFNPKSDHRPRPPGSWYLMYYRLGGNLHVICDQHLCEDLAMICINYVCACAHALCSLGLGSWAMFVCFWIGWLPVFFCFLFFLSNMELSILSN